jgi:hypothetical protein
MSELENEPGAEEWAGNEAGKRLAAELEEVQPVAPDEVTDEAGTGATDEAGAEVTQARSKVSAAYEKTADFVVGRTLGAKLSVALAERRWRRAEMTPEQLKSKRRRLMAGAAAAGTAVVAVGAAKHGFDHHGVVAGGHEHALAGSGLAHHGEDLPPIQAQTASKLIKAVNRPHVNEHEVGAMEAIASHNVLTRVFGWMRRKHPGDTSAER